MQRRHPLRRHGRALARRPRSPSTPPGPHPVARRGLRSRAGCSRCACAPPRRGTAGYPVIGSEARSAAAARHTAHSRQDPSPCTPCTAAPPPPLMLSSRLPGAVAGNCSTPEIMQRSPGRSTPRRTRRRRSPSGSLMIRSWTGKSVPTFVQEASDPGQWITPRRAIFAVRDPRSPHEICHHRPVNSWVTKPGARLSRAGVATRPTST